MQKVNAQASRSGLFACQKAQRVFYEVKYDSLSLVISLILILTLIGFFLGYGLGYPFG